MQILKAWCIGSIAPTMVHEARPTGSALKMDLGKSCPKVALRPEQVRANLGHLYPAAVPLVFGVE